MQSHTFSQREHSKKACPERASENRGRLMTWWLYLCILIATGRNRSYLSNDIAATVPSSVRRGERKAKTFNYRALIASIVVNCKSKMTNCFSGLAVGKEYETRIVKNLLGSRNWWTWTARRLNVSIAHISAIKLHFIVFSVAVCGMMNRNRSCSFSRRTLHAFRHHSHSSKAANKSSKRSDLALSIPRETNLKFTCQKLNLLDACFSFFPFPFSLPTPN